ncbi:MAG TPA: ABC transporter ATP-binding protein [Solirubrobacterales bacterium]
MAAAAIKVEGLGKSYRLGLEQSNLRETLSNVTRHPLRTLKEKRAAAAEENVLWALRDLSFTIEEGEVVGLIGHNGAGKSTLLKILSRIAVPSTGFAETTGRVGSLLEVGTGFHPELTGRENVFLYGSILGMRRTEIRQRFDEIAEFAEITRFLDTPVKRYSSGMTVRLAFAVAAYLEPEILLVDEVLAVGDASFQRRSMEKMTQVAREGRTVVFVSHNLGLIRSLCERGVLLSRGQVVADGDIEAASDKYLEMLETSSTEDLEARTDRDPEAKGRTRIRRVAVTDVNSGRADVIIGGSPVKIEMEVSEHLPGMEATLTIASSLGQPIIRLDSEVSAPSDVREGAEGRTIECEIPQLPLVPGRYRLDAWVHADQHMQDGLEAAAYFDVELGVLGDRPMHPIASDGLIAMPHVWRLPL